jgi:hypothetical protein
MEARKLMKSLERYIRGLVVIALTLSTMLVAHAAFRGHATDTDYVALLSSDPSLKGTAVDSCATCHRVGSVPDPEKPGAMRHENYCEYCHSVYTYGKGDIRQTLNPFGVDYLAAGRGLEAIKAIAARDSDGDGAANQAELTRATNPGDAASNPSARIAPSRVVSLAEMEKLAASVTQVMLMNTPVHPSGDSYDSYRGYRVGELLNAVAISEAAESIDFISLDGFERTLTMDELHGNWPQGAPVLDLGKADLGDCGWTQYNVKGLDPTRPLPNASILLAFEEDEARIARATIDEKTGKIVGTGPLRLVVPQFHVSPPDMLPSADKACLARVDPRYHYQENYDHNGGKSAFSIVAVRVNPLPKGTRDIDWQKVAAECIAKDQVVFFGALK